MLSSLQELLKILECVRGTFYAPQLPINKHPLSRYVCQRRWRTFFEEGAGRTKDNPYFKLNDLILDLLLILGMAINMFRMCEVHFITAKQAPFVNIRLSK